MFHHSPRILLSLAGLLCLLGLGFGDNVPRDLGTVDPDALSIDQVILQAAQKAQDESKPISLDENSQYIRKEFDMLYTREEYEELKKFRVRQRRTAAIVPSNRERRWTNNVVNYQLESGTFNSRDQFEIEKAINEITHYTCLSFRRTSSGNRVLLQAGFGGCYSRVGMVGGAQELGLGDGCRSKSTIIHEFLHAIGVHHEQTRPDRDDFVEIRFENIQDSVEYNFEKYNWRYINNYSLPYDYLSIMHYGKTAFSTNGQISIATKDSRYQDHIGNSPGLSYGDIRTLNSMHSCVPATCNLKDSECGVGGFVGKDCRCWCAGSSKTHPVEYCFAKDRNEQGSLDYKYHCQDFNTNCAYYVSIGYCKSYPNLMQYHCEQSCGIC